MPATHLVALLDARTDRPFWGRAWLEDVLAQHVPGFAQASAASSDQLLGWSVVSVLGPQTLVQSRPILRTRAIDPLSDFLRAEASCTIGAYKTGELDHATPRDVVRTARFRRFVAAAAGVRLTDPARRSILDALPPFLARDTVGKTDAELLLLRVVAALHEQGDFTQALPEPASLRRAMTSLAPLLPTEAPHAIFVGSARSLAVLHHGGSLLAFEPPTEVQPSTRRFSNRERSGSPASALLWTAAPARATPEGGAERIASGIVSAETLAPTAIERG